MATPRRPDRPGPGHAWFRVSPTTFPARGRRHGPDLWRVRAAANWLNLSTPIGLGIALVGRARLRRGPRGLWYGEGYHFHFPVGGAFTIGSVIITARSSLPDLERDFPGVMRHEEVHTWQYTYALGPLYWPPYCLMMAWSWWRTGDKASANFFERQAGLAAGGYPENGRRPASAARRDLGELARAAARNLGGRLKRTSRPSGVSG